MSETRPSGLPVIDPKSAPVVQEIAHIDSRRRLLLAPRWAERIEWLPLPANAEVQALIVMPEPGRVSIRDWPVDGPRILERYQQYADNPDEAGLENLRMIQDRYNRLVIPIDRRPHLGDAALLHLGLPIERGDKSPVYVAVFPRWIDVLSPWHRNAKNLAGSSIFDDLP